MKLKDARHLTASAQEALRYRVVNAVEGGMSKSEAARVFNVSRTAVHNWTKVADQSGASSLKAKKRGPHIKKVEKRAVRERVKFIAEIFGLAA